MASQPQAALQACTEGPSQAAWGHGNTQALEPEGKVGAKSVSKAASKALEKLSSRPMYSPLICKRERRVVVSLRLSGY